MAFSELNPLKWEKSQRLALVLAAAIGTALMLVWQQPSLGAAKNCINGVSPSFFCERMWAENFMPLLGWIVLGAAISVGIVYVARLMAAK